MLTKAIMKVLTQVDQVIINMVNPINFAITDEFAELFGKYDSSMRDKMTTDRSSSAPMVVRSTHVGGNMKTVVVMKRMNISGQTNRFT